MYKKVDVYNHDSVIAVYFYNEKSKNMVYEAKEDANIYLI